VSRRDQIVMTADEVAVLLDESRTVIVATNGRDGWPHLMPLWYVTRDRELWAWTYAKSQKVRNLERDARCTLQVEAGEEYVQLRGVMLECDAVIHRELDTVAGVGAEIAGRYGLPVEAMRAQAPKRVGLQFVERRRATWDHRKLGGTY
jgi:PPOX class probable F420-dependent enzyme